MRIKPWIGVNKLWSCEGCKILRKILWFNNNFSWPNKKKAARFPKLNSETAFFDQRWRLQKYIDLDCTLAYVELQNLIKEPNALRSGLDSTHPHHLSVLTVVRLSLFCRLTSRLRRRQMLTHGLSSWTDKRQATPEIARWWLAYPPEVQHTSLLRHLPAYTRWGSQRHGKHRVDGTYRSETKLQFGYYSTSVLCRVHDRENAHWITEPRYRATGNCFRFHRSFSGMIFP